MVMISLRPLHMNDLPIFLEIRNDCADSLHDNRRFTLCDTLCWWKENWGTDMHARNGPLHYEAIDVGSGMVGYVRIQEDYRNKIVAVGVDIHKDHRRKGYAQAAYKELFKYYFGQRQFNRIELEVLVTNSAAEALYYKLGFKPEGIRRQAVKRDDIYIDSRMMSILREEWNEEI